MSIYSDILLGCLILAVFSNKKNSDEPKVLDGHFIEDPSQRSDIHTSMVIER